MIEDRDADLGTADPRLAAALAGYDGSRTAHAEALAALAGARVFVAVTARKAAAAEPDRPDRDRPGCAGPSGRRAPAGGAQLSLVSIAASDGQRALPAFPDAAALARWRDGLRPVPVRASYLARAALDDGAAAVLLDPDGAAVVLRRDELAALADGFIPVAGSRLAVQRAPQQLRAPEQAPAKDFLTAVSLAVGPERLRAARLLEGPDGLVLGVVPRRELEPPAVLALAERVMLRLGAALPAAGLCLAVVPPAGPGFAVPLPRR